jgi:hypothetical protein
MASIPDTSDDDIRSLNRESARLEAETRKLLAEANKLSAEQLKLSAERDKLHTDVRFSPWILLAQGALAAAALMGAGAALAKLFLA